jgi:single-strand selective monofunctional uracil DNA glycosylase
MNLMSTPASPLAAITARLRKDVDELTFADPVTHVYNPLTYARRPHERYLERWGTAPKEAVFLGMNPGPFGMAQTGVPFGEVSFVRDFVGVREAVDRPRFEHPKRPVEGFSCARSEVSGQRFWGWAQQRFETPDKFFARFFVINYCPLVFMEESGKNRTPDKLPLAERTALYAACDRAIGAMIDVLAPKYVIGVGAFAEERAREALADRTGLTIGTILHPSPASPAANKGWAEKAEAQLRELGIELP